MPVTRPEINKNSLKAVVSRQDAHPSRKLDAWLSPPASCSLPGDDIHLWRGRLDQPPWRVQQLAQTLSADERARANRFRFEIHRARFIVARATLRVILSHYLDIEPDQVQLCYGPHGKPYLHEDMNQALIRFSVAHSHQLAVYALTRAREIGIDLEYTHPVPHIEQTAAGFMTRGELARLSALPAGQQQEAFYLCWTCKEAYVKARGVGLGQPLERLEVSITPGRPACLLGIVGNPRETCRWSLHSFTPAPGYLAALAVEGHGWDITCWDLASLHALCRPRSMAR
jgi:4'-phosphopantetheinyl transferase